MVNFPWSQERHINRKLHSIIKSDVHLIFWHYKVRCYYYWYPYESIAQPKFINLWFWHRFVILTNKDGNKKVRGGTILPNHVWTLPPGDRFVVPFNSLNQPIIKGGYVLVWFIGDIARNGDVCPIDEVYTHKIDKSYKVDIVTLVRVSSNIFIVLSMLLL